MKVNITEFIEKEIKNKTAKQINSACFKLEMSLGKDDKDALKKEVLTQLRYQGTVKVIIERMTF